MDVAGRLTVAIIEAVESNSGWSQPGSLADGMERFGRNIAPMSLLRKWKDGTFPYRPPFSPDAHNYKQ